MHFYFYLLSFDFLLITSLDNFTRNELHSLNLVYGKMITLG